MLTLHKLIKTVPRRMHAVIKANGTPMKVCVTSNSVTEYCVSMSSNGEHYILTIVTQSASSPSFCVYCSVLLTCALVHSRQLVRYKFDTHSCKRLCFFLKHVPRPSGSVQC